ncbi:MAG: Gfo/Idh/MocA family oxidoreductase [Anaerolineae bacterium]
MNRIHWGILGTGKIAHQFATGLKTLPDAKLLAVGSRSRHTADEFGVTFDVPRTYSSYEALAADADVQIVYIGTPHPMHFENTMLCLEAGKAVLCEKPFALNARQAAQMIAKAREKNLFVMEAMWTRFIPAVAEAKRKIDSGDIGEVWMIAADFGFRKAFDPKSRLFDPTLGGGALLDVGIYPIAMASWFFGAPVEIKSAARMAPTGVDEVATMQIKYQGGQLAALSCAISLKTRMEATFAGTEGYLVIHAPFWKATQYSITLPEGAPSTPNAPHQVFTVPYESNGYQFEAIEAMRCLREGLTESPTIPLDETLQMMQTLDAIRHEWGLKYPME